MGFGLDKLYPSKSPFHSVAPGKRVQPLGQIDLPVCFGTVANFRKEVLTFEVVGFRGAYHAILGRPCYAKFMAVPNYTYLKLKMPGPRGVITIGSSFEHAYECEGRGPRSHPRQDGKRGLGLHAPARGQLRTRRRYQEGAPQPESLRTRRYRSAPPTTASRKWCSSTFSAPTQTSLCGRTT